MCGIGSITISSKAVRAWDLDEGAKALLLELDSRGKDACGMMAIREDGSLQTQKASVRAPEFVKGMYPVNPTAKAVAVHTRFATKGSKHFPKNNHPVEAGGAWIIHNGVVDDFDTPRTEGAPEVDTYALSHALYSAAARGAKESNRQYAKRLGIALAEVDGSAAVVAVREGEKLMLTFKISGSPLYFVEAQGVRIAASTRTAVEKAADAMGLDLPGEHVETTRKVQGKDVTSTAYVEKIITAVDGRVLSWQDGAHNMLMVPIPERTFKRSWRGGSSAHQGSGYDYRSSYAGHSVGGQSEREKKYPYVHRNGYWRDGEWNWYASSDRSKPKNPPTPEEPWEKKPTISTTAPASGTRVDSFLYPLGTPEPQSPEYDALRRIFHLWRKSSHGLKWARENVAAAASYDQAVERTKKHGNLPPFPTPRELKAMYADPLFQKELDQVSPKEKHLANPPKATEPRAGFVADSCGVVTVAAEEDIHDALVRARARQNPNMSTKEIVELVQRELAEEQQDNSAIIDVLGLGWEVPSSASMNDIVEHMLAQKSLEEEHARVYERCDLCNEECDDVEQTHDGALCGDCMRVWEWSR